jgi:hypothetical protein
MKKKTHHTNKQNTHQSVMITTVVAVFSIFTLVVGLHVVYASGLWPWRPLCSRQRPLAVHLAETPVICRRTPTQPNVVDECQVRGCPISTAFDAVDVPTPIKGVYVSLYYNTAFQGILNQVSSSTVLSYINTIVWWPGSDPKEGITTLTSMDCEQMPVSCLRTNGKLNIFCLGGGSTVWSPSTLSCFEHYVDVIKQAGFQGVGFDIEGGTADYEDFEPVFQYIRNAGLVVYVTTSWCKGIGSDLHDQQTFMSKLLHSSAVDIVSMQFYGNAVWETCNTAADQGGLAQKWDNCTTLYGQVTATPKLAISMADLKICKTEKENLDERWSSQYLKDPNTEPFAKDGFVVWLSLNGADLPPVCQSGTT